jgi:interferon-induced GTP-binding protein Mx1
VIHVASPDVPDLTLIDLPGIVRTTTAGQDRSVIREVDELMDLYLQSERTMILAVIPANQVGPRYCSP